MSMHCRVAPRRYRCRTRPSTPCWPATPCTGSTWPSREQAEFPHGQRRTADTLVATLATRAGVLVMPEQEQEATLGRIRAFLASRPETTSGEFTLPMLTGVLRVRQL